MILSLSEEYPSHFLPLVGLPSPVLLSCYY